LRTVLFNLMLQRFNSTEVAERITDRIIQEANHGEQHVRDYLRKNLEFTKPASDEIAEILFRYKCAFGSPEITAQRRSDPL
jgi:murein DD-endopeptidase MepM/ murein hydrolase activator NlpD